MAQETKKPYKRPLLSVVSRALKSAKRWLGDRTGLSYWRESVYDHKPRMASFETKKELREITPRFTVKWTTKGRKVLLANRKLLQAFKHLRDKYYLLDKPVPDKIAFNGITVEKMLGRKVPTVADLRITHDAIYRITLPNGRQFALKDGFAATHEDGFEMHAALSAKMSNFSALDHYAQLILHPRKDQPPLEGVRYFLLMPWMNAPTLKQFAAEGKASQALIGRYERESRQLSSRHLDDAVAKNCFVVGKGRKARLMWFDLDPANPKHKLYHAEE